MLFFALEKDLGCGKDHFGAAGSGHEAPLGEGPFGGIDGGVGVSLSGFLEDSHQIAGVGGIDVFKGLAGRGFDPFAVDKVAVNVGVGGASDGDGTGEGIG